MKSLLKTADMKFKTQTEAVCCIKRREDIYFNNL